MPFHTDDHTLELEGKLPIAKLPREKHLKPRSRFSGGGSTSSFFSLVGIMLGGSFLGSILGFSGNAAFITSFAAGIVFVVSKLTWDFRTFNKKNSHWVAELNQGHTDEANAAFNTLAFKYRGHPQLHAMAVFNLAATEVRKGNLERAIQLYGSVAKGNAFKRTNPQMNQMLPFVLAHAYVLYGELDAAEVWLDEGEKRRKLAHLRFGDGVRAMLMARRHQYRAAVEQLNENWRAIESATQADQMRNIRLLKAMCLAQSDPESEEIATLVAGAKPFKPGEYDYIGTRWPEFQAFLGERGFSR
jgi:hypothetical protein